MILDSNSSLTHNVGLTEAIKADGRYEWYKMFVALKVQFHLLIQITELIPWKMINSIMWWLLSLIVGEFLAIHNS